MFPLLFMLWPLAEIALFVVIGGQIGLLWTLLIIGVTGVLGLWLIQQQSARNALTMRRAMAEMRAPTAEMARGGFVMLAGMLLMLPGFLTDALGLLILLPPVQSALVRYAGWRFRTAAPARRSGPTIIEGEFREVTPAPEDILPPPPSGPRTGSGWTRH